MLIFPYKSSKVFSFIKRFINKTKQNSQSLHARKKRQLKNILEKWTSTACEFTRQMNVRPSERKDHNLYHTFATKTLTAFEKASECLRYMKDVEADLKESVETNKKYMAEPLSLVLEMMKASADIFTPRAKADVVGLKDKFLLANVNPDSWKYPHAHVEHLSYHLFELHEKYICGYGNRDERDKVLAAPWQRRRELGFRNPFPPIN